MENLRNFLVELRTAAWRTSGARFNSARRLKWRDWLATFSIAMFSAVGVGITIIQRIYEYKVGSDIDNYLTALSVFIGLFVIIISLIEWGLNGPVIREKLYDNAVRLNQFHRKLSQALANSDSSNSFNNDEITELRKEYESIKDSCPFNHEPIDDLLFLANHRMSSEFLDLQKKPRISWVEDKYIRIKNILWDKWYFSIFWIIIISLLAAVLHLH